MNSRTLPYEELTPLEQCIANKSLFVQMLMEDAQEHKIVPPVRVPEKTAH